MLDAALAAGEMVYVHCWGGVGRTGTVVGCHLVESGVAAGEVPAALGALRAGTARAHRASPETDAQRGFIAAWASPHRLGARFRAALALAAELHAGQLRKGTDIPYAGHLLAVAATVIEDGGSEDQAIAALLHDAAEDQGGEQVLAAIRARFGEAVAGIVAECSDTFASPKPPWRERKQAYVAHLHTASEGAIRVSLADKLHNARAIVRDLSLSGPALWERFSAGREEQLWYYGELAAAFEARRPGVLATELRGLVDEMGA